jgi:hypothetical protein
MKVQAPDLIRHFPRSPREQLGGYVHLARMLDKARAKAAGTVGEYIYPCPLDQSLLEFLGIPADAFYQAAQQMDDGEILNWLMKTAKPKNPEEVEAWNETLLTRKPRSEESLRHFLEIRNRIAPYRTDVMAWADLLDLEEGRDVPPR